MFGISWSEFFVIVLVAVLVIPSQYWPDVARFLGRVVKFVRRIVWKITDVTEDISRQIDAQAPIDELLRTTTNDVLNEISQPLKKIKKTTGRKRK